MPVALRTRRFTADEYQRMGQVGILSEDDRVELIDGEVLAMTPIGPRHSSTVDRATRVFVAAAGERAIVRVQGPVRLNLYTEPEPDVLLLQPRADFYASRHPGPADVVLVRHTSPVGGSYRHVQPFASDERIAPLLLPDCVVGVGDLIVP